MAEEDKEKVKHDVRLTISSLGNERRTILYKEQTDEEVRRMLETVSGAFGTIRTNESLLLTGSDGQIVIAHLKNVVFVEVHVA